MTVSGDLQARADAGQPAGQFELGRMLMAQPRVTQADAARGIGLIESASRSGFAEASKASAIFEVMGLGRPQNWARALDLLQLASEQGSEDAHRELIVLAGADLPDDASRTMPAAQLRARVSIERLTSVGTRTSLSDAPRIRSTAAFASPAECRWIIGRAQSSLKRALVFGPDGQQQVDTRRTSLSTEFQVPDMDLVLEAVRTRISAATRLPLPLFEPTQVLRYTVGQEFKPHVDFFDPALHPHELTTSGQRIATFLIYLNQDFDGGETEFPRAGVRYRGRQGDAIFWANIDMEGKPDPATLHAGCPPTSGEKWVLSQWIRDRSPAVP